MAQGGKTGFHEFYDYEGSKRLIEALEKDLRELGGVFKEFTSNLNSFSAQFKKSFSETTKSIQENNKAIKALDKTQVEATQQIINYTRENEKLNKSGKETKATIQSVDQIVRGFSKSINDQKQLIKALTNEFNRLDPTVAKDAVRMRELSSELIKAKASVNQVTKATRDSNNVLNAAAGSYNALTQAIANDVNTLKQIPGATNKASAAYKQNEAQITSLQARIRSNTEALKAFDAQIGRNFRNVGNYSSAIGRLGGAAGTLGMAFGFAGTSFLLAQGVREAITNNIELSDSLVNVQRTTDLTSESVRNLYDELKNLDTRTATSGLLEIATVGGRLQVSEKDLLGFVKSVDIVTQALGDELTGTVDEIATTLGRIVALFGDDKEFGVEESIIRIGAVVNELGRKSKANAAFITDFTMRLAGIAPQAKISSEQVAALGAIFGEIAPQRVEAASTAVTRFFVQLGQNSELYAKAAGMRIEEFTDLVNNDAVEAFLRVFEASGKSAEGLQQISKSLGDLDIDQQRAIQVLGAFANSTDRARELLAVAKEEIKDSSSVYEEFNKRNENLAASANKLGKEFTTLTQGTGFFADALQMSIDGLSALIKGIRLLSEGEAAKSFSDWVEGLFGIIDPNILGQDFGKAIAKGLGENLEPTIDFYEKQLLSLKERIKIEPDEVGGFSGRALFADLNNEIQRTEGILLSLKEELKNTGKVIEDDIVGNIKETGETIDRAFDFDLDETLLDFSHLKALSNDLGVEFDGLGDALEKVTRQKESLADAMDALNKQYDEFNEKQIEESIQSANSDEIFIRRIELYQRAKAAGMDYLANMILSYEDFENRAEQIEKSITEQVRLETETREALYEAMWDAADMIGNQVFENQQINAQNELKRFQDEQDARLEAAGENAQLRAQIEEETAQRESEIRKRIAESNRNQVLFNIAIDTAQKVAGIKLAASLAAANAAAVGSLLGPGAAAANAALAYGTVIAQVPIALGLAALQAGLVLSQPLPAYAEGGMVKEDGPIMVNDKPRGNKVNREMITTPQGKKFFYNTDRPVVTDQIPKGSVIDPRDISELTDVSEILKNYSPVHGQTNNLQNQFEIAVKQDRSVNQEMQVFLKRENEQLIDGLKKIMTSQPKEVWGISHGRLAKTYIDANQRIKGWIAKNSD